ncbi:MAG: hypothetical protein P1S46_02060 [bacterium]|nr:hypothetical protein [bacterium]
MERGKGKGERAGRREEGGGRRKEGGGRRDGIQESPSRISNLRSQGTALLIGIFTTLRCGI